MQQAGVDSVSSLSASPFTTSYCSRKMLAYTLSNSTFARTVFQSLLFQGKIFLCKITLKGQTVLFMTDVLVQFEILLFEKAYIAMRNRLRQKQVKINLKFQIIDSLVLPQFLWVKYIVLKLFRLCFFTIVQPFHFKLIIQSESTENHAYPKGDFRQESIGCVKA